MTKAKESTIKIKATYNDYFTHRYTLTKAWDTKKSKALVIMKNPSSTELLETDLTTMLVLNNLSKLDYGSVTLCNLISTILPPYTCNISSKEHKENYEEILKQAKVVDYIIIGWGSFGVGNVKIQGIQSDLLEKLIPYKDKLMYIANPKDPTQSVHPLSPEVRSNWLLRPYTLPSNTKSNTKDN